MAKSGRWLKAFEAFTADIRIKSKEVHSDDPRGAPLAMWDSQRRFLHSLGAALDADIHVLNVLKSRQLGITTISLALVDVFWMAMHPNLTGCLVTDTEKNRNVNRELIVSYINSFPDNYFGDTFRIVGSNREMLKFSNGSRLDLLVAGTKRKSTAWGEGVGYALCHATEVASYGDVEGLKSLEEGFAQNNPHRLFVFESTAKGHNHWATRWKEGLSKLTERSIFIGWWAGDSNRIERGDPRFTKYGNVDASRDERDYINQVRELYDHRITKEQLAWIRWKEDNAGAETDLLDQNQPWTAEQAFVKTGKSFFPVGVLNKDIDRIIDAGVQFKGYMYAADSDFYSFQLIPLNSAEGHTIDMVQLKVWFEPVPEGRYVIGCDPAYGRNDHKDAHCISVWRCYADKLEQVAEFNTPDLEAKHAAWVLFHLAAAYRNCIVNLEINGPGTLYMAEFDHLRQLLSAEMNMARTASRDWTDAGSQARWYLYNRPDSMGGGYMYNFSSNFRTVSTIMYQLSGEYITNNLIPYSVKLLQEMQIVVREENGHIGAPESRDQDCKDDRVYAAALAMRAWIDWTRKEMLAQGLTMSRVKDAETGRSTPQVTMLNSLVLNFLRTAEEQAEAGPEPEPWRTNWGL